VDRSTTVPPAPESKETVYQTGHRLYLTGALDSARVLLERAVAMDTSYADPATDLGALHYDLAMAVKDEHSPARTARLKDALRWFARAERLGNTDAAVYERLCEISVALDDDRSFLRYARKDAERYPFDRQYYNLGLACFNAGEYQNVIKTQKDAVEKFRQSPYLGGFYRQMGRAYMKMDRDQSAERTLETGLKSVDTRMAGVKREKEARSEDLGRLAEDRIAILQLLRRLHQTYHADAKLQEVERLLKEAGALR
jgi:tetratricopeptide (TPR) repeat protein